MASKTPRFGGKSKRRRAIAIRRYIFLVSAIPRRINNYRSVAQSNESKGKGANKPLLPPTSFVPLVPRPLISTESQNTLCRSTPKLNVRKTASASRNSEHGGWSFCTGNTVKSKVASLTSLTSIAYPKKAFLSI